MRRRPLRLPALAAAAAGILPAASNAQPPGAPMRKAGWWEMTMAMSGGPMAMNQTMQVCTDPKLDKPGAAFENLNRRGDCTPGPVERTPQGWRFSTTCKAGATTIQTTGVASGDFTSGYHLDSTTRMSPAPMPQMAEAHMVVDARWLGPCPAGKKPGDMVMGGRSISPPRPAG